MPKEKIEVTRVSCDRCKSTDDTGNCDDGRQEWGETDITYRGHTGGRTWQGDAGGSSHAGKAWLCLRCTNEFKQFLRGGAVNQARTAHGKEGA